MTRIVHIPLILGATLALAACSSEPAPADPAAEADAFAQRIAANTPTPAPSAAATAAPRIAQPLPGAAPGPFIPGTATDPAAATCGANRMGPFIG
ncbi:MAG: hypothetical protein ACK4IB_11685, partial [Erythrobacter sp.]